MQDQLWQMLVLLDSAARSAGVMYFLAYGTAIGAVREQGLIPWDPDIDVLVSRRDYQRLCEALAKEQHGEVEVLRPEHDTHYEFAFARVTKAGIDHKLLYLDIFPLVGAPSSPFAQAIYSRVSRVLRGALLIKRVELSSKFHWPRRKKRAVRAVKLAIAPIPGHLLVAAFLRFERYFDVPEAPVLTNSCGSYGKREFWPREWFSGSSPATIRGREFALPVGNHELLTQIYGDYMNPVPEEQQQRELEFCSTYILPPLRARGILDNSTQ